MHALFIHRSVGQNLITEGKLRELLRKHGVSLDDYNNNTDILTTADGSIATSAISIPGNNTNPSNLAQYFANWDPLLDQYELIIIKSCYPNSRIKSQEQLLAIQKSYQVIFEAFESHQKQLALLTSPPLQPLFTNRYQSQLVGKLNQWLLSQTNEYVRVLDFHALLAEPNGRHAGMLRQEYRRLLPFDNHPNRLANQELAPQVTDFIVANQ